MLDNYRIPRNTIMPITPIHASSEQGKALVRKLEDRFQLAANDCRQKVEEIIDAVKINGDQALISYTNQFDAPTLTVDQLKVSAQEFQAAAAEVSAEFQATLDKAISRIRTFHEHEKEDSWVVTRPDGTITGRLVHAVDSAGLYVPGGVGGKTPLVSSVLMNGIPAAIAGVKRVVMLTPPGPDGRINPALLLAAQKVGVHEVYKSGSAWGIAALAFGTKTIAPVDVIVGPGNQYVTEAKKQVSGRVRIDMIAGPSEVLIIADESAKPSFIAADMLAQAEHDPMALAMLVTTSEALAHEVVNELNRLLPKLSRQEIATKSLQDRGVILLVKTLDQALELANDFAAEHLELMVTDPYQSMTRIRHAGAIFLGNHSPEATGDYLAGPNHVLPTMGTARFSSALGVETFLKKSSLISYSREALLADANDIQAIANLEGLSAHALSVAIRVKDLS
jgi:histidinol dehydrogenase